MGLDRLIQKLQIERTKLDEIIVSLQQLQQAASVAKEKPVKKRRGRKFMDPEERRQVSERMKKYWEGRRQVDA